MTELLQKVNKAASDAIDEERLLSGSLGEETGDTFQDMLVGAPAIAAKQQF